MHWIDNNFLQNSPKRLLITTLYFIIFTDQQMSTD